MSHFEPSYNKISTLSLIMFSLASAIPLEPSFSLSVSPSWSNEQGQGGVSISFQGNAQGGWTFSFPITPGFQINQVFNMSSSFCCIKKLFYFSSGVQLLILVQATFALWRILKMILI
jgi:hypothetical protein